MISVLNYSSSVRLPHIHTGMPLTSSSPKTKPHFSGIDTFERIHTKSTELHFSAKNKHKAAKKCPKDLARELAQMNLVVLNASQREAALEAFALDLFKTCNSQNKLEQFAYEAGIKIHHAEAHTAIGQLMEKTGAQGFAVYPKSKIPGMPEEARYHFGKHDIRTEPGFGVIWDCERDQKPLVLIKQPINNSDISLYVMRHEIFHILQAIFGFYPVTSTNYLTQSIASEDHLDFMKELRTNPNSPKSIDIKSKAEASKHRQPVPNSYGEALRHVTSLDLANYRFFRQNGSAIGLSTAMQSHNDNLYDIYKIVYNFSKSPHCDDGRGSRIMTRSTTEYGNLMQPGGNTTTEEDDLDMADLIARINNSGTW